MSFFIHPPRGDVRNIIIIFGDQLDREATVLQEIDKKRDAVLMMEAAGESREVPSHKQRTVLFLSAMRHFATELKKQDIRVIYHRLDDEDNPGTLYQCIEKTVQQFAPEQLRCTLPGEWRVLQMLQSLAGKLKVDLDVTEDQHFLTTPEEFSEWAAGRKEVVLEFFYRAQRKKTGILMKKDGKPVGGEWNFDKENREKFKSAPQPPAPYTPTVDEITREVMELVERVLPDLPGKLDHFQWPVTRRTALKALDDFIEKRLPNFGTFQDAMWTDQPWLYHSRISPAVNLKLLHPREIIDCAVEAYDAGKAPINSVEGFVRQLLGWREFIRGVYWHEGSDYGNRNYLDEHGELPEFYWTGETDMACMRDCLGQVVEHGYGHHIQRLMITGNFALIAGIDPRAISDWYLGMYVDAVDWVTLPNTLGMVMHADGGVVGTKPYAASANYINKMSNYCKNCPYDRKSRDNEDSCPFNTFYWDFLLRNEDKLSKNQRMAMSYRNVERISADEKKKIRSQAKKHRATFGI